MPIRLNRDAPRLSLRALPWQFLCFHKTSTFIPISVIFQAKYPKVSQYTTIAAGINKQPVEQSKIRNIGIIAHIDAGKTTITEQMLYLCGLIKTAGKVDQGSTIMDFLPEERQRGITINSAAITLKWQGSRINLVDTPGHADFTFEVQRSIRVLDGVVCIIDGSKGVEAQTEKVWKQASQYNVAKLIFVNKLDRESADFSNSIRDCAIKLNCLPAVLQLPVYEDYMSIGQKFVGVLDVIEQKIIQWNDSDNFVVKDLTECKNWKLVAEAEKARSALIELCTDFDDDLLDEILQIENITKISSQSLIKSVKKCSQSGKIVPVLCGSAYKSLGIQPLLDAVVNYLPCPNNSKSIGKFCALAFKVSHDPKRGMLTFVRIYDGSIQRGSTLFNINTKCQEKLKSIVYPFAEDFVDTDSVGSGEIAIFPGLKGVSTGDTLINIIDSKTIKTQLLPLEIPEPVFTTAIEANSFGAQQHLDESLRKLVLEDPSLRASIDDQSNQFTLSGMGELHIDVAWKRLLNHYNVKAERGPLEICMREQISKRTYKSYILDEDIGGKELNVKISIEVEPINSAKQNGYPLEEQLYLEIDSKLLGKIAKELDTTNEAVLLALKRGVKSGSLQGKLHNLPLYGMKYKINDIQFTDKRDISAITIALQRDILLVIRDTPREKILILEPYVNLFISTDLNHAGEICQDLIGKRGGVIVNLHDSTENFQHLRRLYIPFQTCFDDPKIAQNIHKQNIQARVPLSSLLGYNKVLQQLTGGRGEYHFVFFGYLPLHESRKKQLKLN